MKRSLLILIVFLLTVSAYAAGNFYLQMPNNSLNDISTSLKGYIDGSFKSPSQADRFVCLVNLKDVQATSVKVNEWIKEAKSSYVFILEKPGTGYGKRSLNDDILINTKINILVMWFYPKSDNQIPSIIQAIKDNFQDSKEAHVIIADISRALFKNPDISIEYENTFPFKPFVPVASPSKPPIIPITDTSSSGVTSAPHEQSQFDKLLQSSTKWIKNNKEIAIGGGAVALGGIIYLIASPGGDKPNKLPQPPGPPAP